MNPDISAFPSSYVGERTRLRRLSADPFSSPTSVWGEISEPDNEAVPMAPLRQRCSYFLDDGPRYEIQEDSIINIQMKLAIPPSVVMRCPSEFERAPDGRSDEIAIYEAYLEAGFLVGVPSIVAEVSSFFCFCPSQLTPPTWRTLMAIQVLGKPGFYHLRSRDGTPLVEEPSRGIKGNYPFGDDWDTRYLFLKIPGSSPYPSFWRTVDVARPMSFIGEVVTKLVLGVPQRFRNVARLPVSIIYDEYQKAKTRKRRPFHTPPPRLVRAASSVSGPSFVPPAVRGMAFHRDQSVLQGRATTRWELMKEWLDKKVDHWNPEEEYCRYLFSAEGVDQMMTGGPVQAATSGSAAGSRYSGDPSF
ncbi:hypothetical protein DY000_02049171 [Brassica cretica]|uniref:Uncharacterized protein n=1 Tax=Brassica cretica TaxID=69181 RepID=A0ABQ7F6F0_BRACR|nr:hypothetical protein DY000_02049171 [Brassica cretica]